MEIHMRDITDATKELIRKTYLRSKEIHAEHVEVYRRGLGDCLGPNWPSEHKNWPDRARVIAEYERKLRDAFFDTPDISPADKKVFSSIISACRNVVFANVPFQFRHISTKRMLEAEARMSEITDDPDPVKRFEKALKLCQKGDRERDAIKTAERNGYLIMHPPKDTDEAEEYAALLMGRLAKFLGREDVQNLLTGTKAAGLLGQVRDNPKGKPKLPRAIFIRTPEERAREERARAAKAAADAMAD
jgi:hypothetical protein